MQPPSHGQSADVAPASPQAGETASPTRRDLLGGAAALSAAAALAATDALRPNPAAAQPQSESWSAQIPAPDATEVTPPTTDSGTVDPASLGDLQTAINQVAASGGGDVSLSVAGDYQVAQPLSIPSNTRVFLGGGVRLVATGGVSDLVVIAAGATNSALVGGTLDGANQLSGAAVTVSDGFDHIAISGVDIVNTGASAESRMAGIRFGQGTRASVLGCTFDGLFQNIHISAPLTDLTVHGCRAQNLASLGNLVQLWGEVNRVWITDNVCTGHRADAVGGHIVQTSGETNGFNHRNIWITGNYFTGIAAAWGTDASGDPVPNGGSGDVIACRSLDGFVVANNILRNPGEYGITAVHGARNGQIRDNLIVDADGSGIICGTPQNSAVTNIAVSGNTIINAGRNRAGDLGRVATSAVRFWGAINCSFTNNSLVGYSRNGLYLQSPAVGEAPSVVDFHHANNRYVPEAGNSEQPFYDLDTDHGGSGEPNWTAATVI